MKFAYLFLALVSLIPYVTAAPVHLSPEQQKAVEKAVEKAQAQTDEIATNSYNNMMKLIETKEDPASQKTLEKMLGHNWRTELPLVKKTLEATHNAKTNIRASNSAAASASKDAAKKT